MIIELSDQALPMLTDAGRLDRLHATVTGDPASIVFGGLCHAGPDDDHVWADIDELRAAGLAQVDDPDFASNFDGMIAYATKKGWLDDTATLVRAHIER
jgi:hypothetical protein